ncbi:hypothetical protein BKE38_22460 [Pseudoroseomonas deserti]|uniref:Uncharacterized protein n=1 Tax=Teichococcus deserti TaxID=1817963 RepID=A0A1V2GYU2_9PROT|nr:hypothetical protein [Pseudoroseomonas deserti]ONG47984.1 hypothetical protein BKE38_22460 [Pseudoroseomonas deserti]
MEQHRTAAEKAEIIIRQLEAEAVELPDQQLSDAALDDVAGGYVHHRSPNSAPSPWWWPFF